MTSLRYGGRMDSTTLPSLSSFSENQLQQNLVVCKYATNCFQNHNKSQRSPLIPCNYVILCFRRQSPFFDELFIFRGTKLKFGG